VVIDLGAGEFKVCAGLSQELIVKNLTVSFVVRGLAVEFKGG